jgi:hypothetical protein
MPHTTPDDRVAAAMDALMKDVGWATLSMSLARWLRGKKQYTARIWVENLMENLERTK